ncbi:hypothetical protein GTP56_02015 [Duganella sp. FT134W]|uniref:Uncharacterized protein n=1 Tax=Duganella margarita TaxID=2692170 RepID=A0A7X4KFY2_9BURK|nr:hypothetical protein [Duganella margarita]MYM70973.1 hypothetical protein [Duganella margarita]
MKLPVYIFPVMVRINSSVVQQGWCVHHEVSPPAMAQNFIPANRRNRLVREILYRYADFDQNKRRRFALMRCMKSAVSS